MEKKAAKPNTTPASSASPKLSPVASPKMREVIIQTIEESGKSARSVALNVGISQL